MIRITGEQALQMADMYQNEGLILSEIAERFGVVRECVAKHLRKLGVEIFDKRKVHPNDHGTVLQMYSEGHTIVDTAKHLGLPGYETVAKVLRKAGVTIQCGNTRLAEQGVIQDYFEKDTEGSAYFYGLLLADGCISDSGKVTIAFETGDAHIIQNLIDEIRLNSKVSYSARKDGSGYCQTCFTVKAISDSLTKLGMEPRKSTKEVAPERFLNNRHFWRGLIDGDGHIGKKATRLYLCGSQTICDQFLEYCKSINPSINTQVVHMKGGLFRTTISGIKAATVLNELYSDCSFKLERKYLVAESTLLRYPEVRHVF